jgi:hypothetical protein
MISVLVAHHTQILLLLFCTPWSPLWFSIRPEPYGLAHGPLFWPGKELNGPRPARHEPRAVPGPRPRHMGRLGTARLTLGPTRHVCRPESAGGLRGSVARATPFIRGGTRPPDPRRPHYPLASLPGRFFASPPRHLFAFPAPRPRLPTPKS